MAVDGSSRTRVGAELYVEVLQFLYREADYLDRWEFDAWLELLSDDVVYEMPLTLTRERSGRDRIHDYEMEHFTENLASLTTRVKRLHTEYAWAEDPPTRTRHLVSNVVVSPNDRPGDVIVDCAFAVFANRTNMTDYDVFVGHRRDLLVRRDDDFKLSSRTLWLDQAVVGSNSISVFL